MLRTRLRRPAFTPSDAASCQGASAAMLPVAVTRAPEVMNGQAACSATSSAPTPGRTSARRSSGSVTAGPAAGTLGLKCSTSMRPACCPKRVTASRSASSSVTSRAVQPVVTPSACRAVPRLLELAGVEGQQRDVVALPAVATRHRGAQPGACAHDHDHGVRHVAEPTRRRGHGRLPPWRSGRRGCCTWTSTSSSPRSRCCAVWPGCPSSSAAAATRPSAGWSHRVLRGPGVRGRVRDATAHAARKCPEAVFLPVDAPAYDAASAVVMDTLRSFEVPVEVLGWDEAFMAVETEDPQGFADDVRAAVLDATGLHCSVGIGDNKLRAKIATDFGKPRGTFRLTEETWFEVMGAADRRAVGDRPQDRPEARRPRHRDGVAARRRGHRAARRPPRADHGPVVPPARPRRGHLPVDPSPYVPRGHGRETTFQHDLTDPDEVAAEAARLAVKVLGDVRGEGRPAVRVGMKLRYAPFETRTRSLALPGPTFDEGTVTAAALELLGRFDRRRPVRLLGVRLEMALPTPARRPPTCPGTGA